MYSDQSVKFDLNRGTEEFWREILFDIITKNVKSHVRLMWYSISDV